MFCKQILSNEVSVDIVISSKLYGTLPTFLCCSHTWNMFRPKPAKKRSHVVYAWKDESLRDGMSQGKLHFSGVARTHENVYQRCSLFRHDCKNQSCNCHMHKTQQTYSSRIQTTAMYWFKQNVVSGPGSITELSKFHGFDLRLAALENKLQRYQILF